MRQTNRRKRLPLARRMRTVRFFTGSSNRDRNEPLLLILNKNIGESRHITRHGRCRYRCKGGSTGRKHSIRLRNIMANLRSKFQHQNRHTRRYRYKRRCRRSREDRQHHRGQRKTLVSRHCHCFIKKATENYTFPLRRVFTTQMAFEIFLGNRQQIRRGNTQGTRMSERGTAMAQDKLANRGTFLLGGARIRSSTSPRLNPRERVSHPSQDPGPAASRSRHSTTRLALRMARVLETATATATADMVVAAMSIA
jgi:hypothetical protein